MSSLEQTRRKAPFWLSATKEQAKDTGMALVLICLLAFLFTNNRHFVSAGLVLLLLDMISPALYKPAAKLWFGLSSVLGTVMSKVLLSLVFALVLTPMGLLRKVLGKDPMRVRQFKNGDASAFRVREHTFVAADIEQPF